jgi:magnesium transporter
VRLRDRRRGNPEERVVEPGQELVEPSEGLTAAELAEAWPLLDLDERVRGLRVLPHAEASEFFLGLKSHDQSQVLCALHPHEQRLWLRQLPPDDLADLLQQVEPERRLTFFTLLDDAAKKEVSALLAYAEDAAGGLMNTRFARVRPDMTADEAIRYLRRQARDRQGIETIYYVYVLDAEQRLLGVASFRELFAASPDRLVREIMHAEVVSVPEQMDQEAVARVIAENDVLAVPVLDEQRHMKGIITHDDIQDVVQEEATEDIQKIGGTEALDQPYLQTSFPHMIRKRAGWLSALFLGETLTASAMNHFQGEIQKAVVLSLFIPLIISSGGNSGSQATTLVIRAMALGEVKLRDWWMIARRELLAGATLGSILAIIGVVRILVWQSLGLAHYPEPNLVAATVALSLIGVATWGTLAGSMLPFILKRMKFDPASASAPFVATLVDVSGLVIYFTVASVVMAGTLL